MGWKNSKPGEGVASDISRRGILRSLVVAGGLVSGTASLTGIASAEQVTRTQTKPFTESNATVQFDFANLPSPTSDIDVAVSITGDYGHDTEYADILVEGQLLGTINVTGDNIDCNTFSDSFTADQSNITQGELQITVDNSENVDAFCEVSEIEVTISYSSNTQPSASFTVSPQPLYDGEPATFDASGSSDPNGRIVKYEWDFDGDGEFEVETSSSTITKTLGERGYRQVTLRVTDNAGSTGTASRRIGVHDVFTTSPLGGGGGPLFG